MKVLMGTEKGEPDDETIKLIVHKDVSDRLWHLVKTHGRASRQEIIYELISYYLPVWNAVEGNLRQAIGRHTQDTTSRRLNGEARVKRNTDVENADFPKGKTLNPKENGNRDKGSVSRTRKRNSK